MADFDSTVVSAETAAVMASVVAASMAVFNDNFSIVNASRVTDDFVAFFIAAVIVDVLYYRSCMVDVFNFEWNVDDYLFVSENEKRNSLEKH